MNASAPPHISHKKQLLHPSLSEDLLSTHTHSLAHLTDTPSFKETEDELIKQEMEKEIEGHGFPLPSFFPSCPTDKTLKKEEKSDAIEVFSSLCTQWPMPADMTSPSSTVASSSRPLSPELEKIFEKMASLMIVMNSSGEMETTLFLDNPSSVFFGTKITIREFSTAPKAFNVEITSSALLVSKIESGKNDLFSAFHKGNFDFSIHRLETGIHQEDRPVLHRKESTDSDEGKQEGGQKE